MFSGNLGLYDQLLAQTWVRENILQTSSLAETPAM